MPLCLNHVCCGFLLSAGCGFLLSAGTPNLTAMCLDFVPNPPPNVTQVSVR